MPLIGSLIKAAEEIYSAEENKRIDTFFLHKIATEIIAPALKADPVFSERDGRDFICTAQSACSANSEILAERFSEQLAWGYSAAQIETGFRSSVTEGTAEIIDVWLIFGIRVSSRVDISEDLWIENIDNIENFPQLNKFFNPDLSSFDPLKLWHGPRVAIFRKYVACNLLRSPPDPSSWRTRADKQIEDRSNRDYRRLFSVLAVLTQCPMAEMRRMSFCPTPGSISSAALSSYLFSPNQTFMVAGTDKQTYIDKDEMKRWYDEHHQSPMWDQLRVPIARLLSSRVQIDDTNKIIDLGIAFESSLMHGESSTGEITNKISTRYAWIAGEDRLSRTLAAKKAKDFYKLRSEAVHNGRLKSKFDYEETHEICRKTIKYLIEAKKFPDWNDLIFG